MSKGQRFKIRVAHVYTDNIFQAESLFIHPVTLILVLAQKRKKGKLPGKRRGVEGSIRRRRLRPRLERASRTVGSRT